MKRKNAILIAIALMLNIMLTSTLLVAEEPPYDPSMEQPEHLPPAAREELQRARELPPRMPAQPMTPQNRLQQPMRGGAPLPTGTQPTPPQRGEPSMPQPMGDGEQPPKASPTHTPDYLMEGKRDEQVLIQLDFVDTPITTIIEMISKYTNKNFMYDERVRGNVTIISPKKVTVKEAYKVLLSILEMKGFSLVESGDIVKILPMRDAKTSSIETHTQGDKAEVTDNFITQLIPLQYVSAMTLQNGIRQIVSKEGVIFPYEETNTLIIIDTATNIKRIMNITKELDVPGPEMSYEVIQIKYASAADIFREISSMFSGGAKQLVSTPAAGGGVPGMPPSGGGSTMVKNPFKIISDERTNSIIVFADEASLKEIKNIIEKLDIDVQQSGAKVNVYYLKYANAEEMAEVLTKFSQEVKKRLPTTKLNIASGKQPANPNIPASPDNPQPQFDGKDVKSGKMQLEGDVTITADKATNSLIVIASSTDFDVLKGVIDKLDIMRPQVLVEAFIIEISLDRERELGIEWRSTSDFTKNDTTVIGGTNFGTINNISTNPLAAPSGLMLGTVKGSITFAGKEFLNVGALVRALETEAGINVMSRPQILTMDNEEAEINVVENIPYKISEKYDTNGNPIFSYDYKDVGLVLKLTTQVMESNFVKLKINQEISQVINSTRGIEVTAPTTSKRIAKTNVFVKDQETVIIGGLIKDNTMESESRVPCLGDLPFLGVFFRANNVKKQKTDLMVFLTPRIIRDYSQLEDISSQRKEELNNFKDKEEFDDFKQFNVKKDEIEPNEEVKE